MAANIALTVAEAARAAVRRPTRRGTLLELRGRPTAEGTQAFFVNVHGVLGSGRHNLLRSHSWLAVEITRSDGALRYQIWIPDDERDLVTRLLRASYPDLELVPAPTTLFSQRVVAVTHLGLALGRYLPIRSAHTTDPLAGLLAMIAGAPASHELLVQVLLSPSFAWTRDARSEAYRIRAGRRGPDRDGAATSERRERAREIEKRGRMLAYDSVLRIAAGASSARDAREL